jgi:hypothetical protein
MYWILQTNFWNKVSGRTECVVNSHATILSAKLIKYYAGISNVLPPFMCALVKGLRHAVLAIWLFPQYCD